MSPITYLSIYLSTHYILTYPFIHPEIQSSTFPASLPPTHTLIYPLHANLLTHPQIHSPPIHPSIQPSFHASIHLLPISSTSTHQLILCTHTHLFTHCPSTNPSTHTYPLACLFTPYPSTPHPSIYRSFCPSIHPQDHLLMHPLTYPHTCHPPAHSSIIFSSIPYFLPYI